MTAPAVVEASEIGTHTATPSSRTVIAKRSAKWSGASPRPVLEPLVAATRSRVERVEGSMDISFILVKRAMDVTPHRMAAAARKRGLALEYEGTERNATSFKLDDAVSVIVVLLPPHPDVPKMQRGPLSPTREEMLAAQAHLVVTTQGLEGDVRSRDDLMARLTAAFVDSTDAVAAMLGHGVVFHRAEMFSKATSNPAFPCEILVDITKAPAGPGRMSLLTHGMARYDREELFVTCSFGSKGVFDFIYPLVRWLLDDRTKQLLTGETIGRTNEEQIRIQRVEHPANQGPQVIRLDLP